MDLLIKDGKLIDGSGAPAQKLDILIKNGKILKIAPEIESSSSKTIDAGGRYVCPGFIDIHNHADLTILEENKAEAYVMQGITTILAGVCGIGVYPTNNTVKKYYYNFVSKAFCTSPDLYEDLNQFSQAFETIGLSVNIGLMIPQGNVRACVMGTETRSADQSELNQMKQLIRKNMEFGAFGLSTGLVYPPGSTTSTEELIEITKVVSEYNGFYDSHMRNEGAGVIDIGMKELLRIAKEAQIRAHISHWSVIRHYN